MRKLKHHGSPVQQMRRNVAPRGGGGLPGIHGNGPAPSAEEMPEPHHGEGVQAAIGFQLPADLLFPAGWGVFSDGLLEGLHRHAAVFHAGQGVVVQVRCYSGKDVLDAPAATLGRGVVVLPGDGQTGKQGRRYSLCFPSAWIDTNL
jgi:hypothetical protein